VAFKVTKAFYVPGIPFISSGKFINNGFRISQPIITFRGVILKEEYQDKLWTKSKAGRYSF
jgi:hypothetical protein